MICEMGRERMNGIMDNFTKEIGRMAKRMDMEFGNLPTEIVMWVIGSMDDNKEKEPTAIKPVSTKEIL